VKERFQDYRAAGVNCLHCRFEGTTQSNKYEILERVFEML